MKNPFKGLYFCGMPQRIQLKFSPEEAANDDFIKAQFLRDAKLKEGKLVLVRKSLDSRSRSPFFIVSGDVYSSSESQEDTEEFKLQNVSNARPVHIIGAGPAGLFAALQCIELGFKPIVIERGKNVKEMRRDLAVLNKEKVVNPESNYCFGEGGAGTYSDGKLYTRSDKRGPIQKVLNTFIQYGAAANIAYDAHPHIGTNKLPAIIEKIRMAILDCGGEVRFDAKLIDLELQGRNIVSLVYSGGLTENVNQVILATGHSARDIYELLDRKKIAIEAKPFAFGVRLEHPQEIIDKIQYKCDNRGLFLPPSTYSLVEQIESRGVFSFCMCPGGIIAPAATNSGEVVVNGWSPSKRSGKFANSGFVVTVDELDFKPFKHLGALSGMGFQSFWEKQAFKVSGSLSAPAQRIEDFVQKRISTNLPVCSYIPGVVSSDIREVLPAEISERIRLALVRLGQKMPGFRSNEAILVGVESRTSSPVRIPRNKENLQHVELHNLYPCAEGAGYAGGIMSAAIDGINVVKAIERA